MTSEIRKAFCSRPNNQIFRDVSVHRPSSADKSTKILHLRIYVRGYVVITA